MLDQELVTLVKQCIREVLREEEYLNIPHFAPDNRKVFAHKSVELGNTTFNTNSGTITIGSHSFFGANCSVITGSHNPNAIMKERKRYLRSGNDIVIGEGVWIASHAVILGPSTIGDHAVIAAGAVVLPGEYEGGYLYGGVPAKQIKKLDIDL